MEVINGNSHLEFGDTTVILEGYSQGLNVYDDGSEVYINGTVICTYLNELGEIPDDVYRWDAIYGQNLGETVQRGYQVWAIPFVGCMRKSPLLTRMVTPFAQGWAQEMAHLCDPDNYKGSWLGRAILVTGVPVCRAIGCVMGAWQNKQLPFKA